MKKFFFAVLAAVTLVFGFTACDEFEEDIPETTTVKAGYSFDPLSNDTFRSLCDMNLTTNITLADGKTATDTYKADGSVEILTILPCPCTITFNYSFAPKNASIDDAQSYSLEFGPKITVNTSDGGIAMRGTKRSMTISGDKLKEYLEKLASEKYEITFTVDKDGKVSVKE